MTIAAKAPNNIRLKTGFKVQGFQLSRILSDTFTMFDALLPWAFFELELQLSWSLLLP